MESKQLERISLMDIEKLEKLNVLFISVIELNEEKTLTSIHASRNKNKNIH